MSILNRIFRSRRPAFRLSWLTSDIAVSKEPSEDDWASIYEAGVRCVLDLRAEEPDNEAIVSAKGLRYLRLPIEEWTAPTDQQLSLLTDWIVERIGSDGPVLVHCREGRGRSPLVACAALVKLGLPPFQAFQTLLRVRPESALNDEQIEVLQRFSLEQEKRREDPTVPR